MIIRTKQEKPLSGKFVKVVVDIDRVVVSVDCELHIDCAEELIEDGSQNKNLWGANIYPKEKKIDFISFINIRPKDNNRSMEIQIPAILKKVETIIKDLLF